MWIGQIIKLQNDVNFSETSFAQSAGKAVEYTDRTSAEG